MSIEVRIAEPHLFKNGIVKVSDIGSHCGLNVLAFFEAEFATTEKHDREISHCVRVSVGVTGSHVNQ